MTEKLNEIDIEVIEKTPEMTPYAGAILFRKMCEGMELPEIINQSLNVRGSRGYQDSDHILSMITMQILGGSTIDDLDMLKQNLETHGSPIQVPSPTAARTFMSNFHDEEEAKKLKQGYSYIPQSRCEASLPLLLQGAWIILVSVLQADCSRQGRFRLETVFPQ